MKKFLLASCALFTVLALGSLNAAHRSSPDEARAFFDNAIAYVNEVGPDEAASTFNDPDSEFVKGDLYVFALSTDGMYLANGGFPQLAGQPIEGVYNAAGEPIYKIIMSAVDNAEKTGVALYEWLNPQTNQLEDKSAYVSEVYGIVVGVGYYE